MTAEIEGVTLHLAHPDEIPIRWVGQEEVMRQLLAAWLLCCGKRTPALTGHYFAAIGPANFLFADDSPMIMLGAFAQSDLHQRT